QAVAVRNPDPLAVLRDQAAGIGQRLFQRPKHQGERRSKLMTDIGEEHRLGAVELCERLRAPPLLLISVRMGDGSCDQGSYEAEKAAIVLVEQSERIEADDQDTGSSCIPSRGNLQKRCLARRSMPGAGRRAAADAGRQIR